MHVSFVSMMACVVIGSKKTHKEQNKQTKFPRDCPGIFGGILFMCFSPP